MDIQKKEISIIVIINKQNYSKMIFFKILTKINKILV
jgi:hypothetical protein